MNKIVEWMKQFLQLLLLPARTRKISHSARLPRPSVSSCAKGASWEITVDWLLENDVDVFIVERFDQLLTTIWDYLDEEEA